MRTFALSPFAVAERLLATDDVSLIEYSSKFGSNFSASGVLSERSVFKLASLDNPSGRSVNV